MALRLLLHGLVAAILLIGAYWPVFSSASQKRPVAANPVDAFGMLPCRTEGVYTTDLPGAEQEPLIFRICLEHWRTER
jgi:hypothetical protein